MLPHIFAALEAGLKETLAMVAATFWALVFGFLLSGMVQAFARPRQVQALLGGRGLMPVLRATGLGAASSSCSYAASAMAKSLFSKGADFVAAMVFMLASTNLVVELGVVIAVLIGWQFTASEIFAGLLMICLLVLLATITLPESVVARARARLGAQSDSPAELGDLPSLWDRLRQPRRWRDAAGYAVADLTMLRRELAGGFLAAGFLAALVPDSWWRVLFITGHGTLSTLENVAVGPLIAILSFVCSVGNVPLAAALWKGGISFGGVLSFLLADLITLPLLLIYRRFYGWQVMLRILVSFWLVISATALITQYLAAALGLVPRAHPLVVAPTALSWNAGSGLDLFALLLLVAAWAATSPRLGTPADPNQEWAIDPVCGMRVEKASAPAKVGADGAEEYFCSDRCRNRWLRRSQQPEEPMSGPAQAQTQVDPVCGMSVVPDSGTPQANTPDGPVYFCCESCRERFLSRQAAPTNTDLGAS